MLAILGVSGFVHASLLSLLLSSHGVFPCVSVFFCVQISLKRTLVIELGPTLIQYDLIWTWLHLQRPYFLFQIKVISTNTGVWILTSFWRQFNPQQLKYNQNVSLLIYNKNYVIWNKILTSGWLVNVSPKGTHKWGKKI